MKLTNTPIWKITALILALLIISNSGRAVTFNFSSQGDAHSALQIVKPVLAKDIYPKFTCPCCGQPLNKEEPCCQDMIDMTNYIDQQVESGKSEQDVILATAKEFGLERLTYSIDQANIKQFLAAQAPADAPKITMSETQRDLGTVSQKQGKVHTDFQFTNEGKTNLVINKLSSSCGCTSGAIVYHGQEGPTFTMPGHGQDNPTDWQVAIAPGDQAILRVYYDPNVHKDLVGAVTRTVSIFSNDPVEFEKKVTITLEQTK